MKDPKSVVDRILSKITIENEIEVSNQMMFLTILTDLGLREEKSWGEDEEELYFKLLKLAKKHSKHQMEIINKYQSKK